MGTFSSQPRLESSTSTPPEMYNKTKVSHQNSLIAQLEAPSINISHINETTCICIVVALPIDCIPPVAREILVAMVTVMQKRLICIFCIIFMKVVSSQNLVKKYSFNTKI